MIFLETFLHSIKLPNKKAAFKLNRIGMDVTVVYMFILLMIISIPDLINRILSPTSLGAEMNLFFIVIYFFIFYYLPLLIIVFALLSLFSYVEISITRMLRRKIRYAILWKMNAYLTTIPFIIYSLLAMFLPGNSTYLWLLFLYTIILSIKIITIYPKRKPR